MFIFPETVGKDRLYLEGTSAQWRGLSGSCRCCCHDLGLLSCAMYLPIGLFK